MKHQRIQFVAHILHESTDTAHSPILHLPAHSPTDTALPLPRETGRAPVEVEAYDHELDQ